MAMGTLLGLGPHPSFGKATHSNISMGDSIFVDEMKNEGTVKMALPMLSSIPRFNLSDVNHDSTGRKINIHLDKGTTTLAFVYQGGIVVCADSRATGGQYIGSGTVKKIIPINKYMLGTMAGGAADCVYWERILSERCRLHELRNRETISVAAASKLFVNMLYNYKGMGLSLGVMICGWDRKKGPKVYFVDNDARRVPGNRFSIGSGSVYAYGVLDKGYKFDMSDEEAFDLGRRSIFHATHRDAYSGGIVRVYSVKEDGWKIISEDDMSILYDRYTKEGSVSMNH